MKSLVRLAGKTAALGNKVVKHIDTANRVLNTVQSVADEHLKGTDLHKKIARTVGLAQGKWLSRVRLRRVRLLQRSAAIRQGKRGNAMMLNGRL